MNELAKIESFRRDLALAETFEQIKLLGDAGEAYAEFMKRQVIGKDGINKLGKFLIEVDAKKGDWLNVNYPRGGGRNFKLPNVKLESMPASPKESARARTLTKTSNK